MDVSEVFEALFVEPFYGFCVSCNWSYVEESCVFFAGFGEGGLDELVSYAFAAVGFAYYEGFYLSLVALKDEPDEAYGFCIVGGDPELVWSDFCEVFVKLVFWVFSAYGWVLVDFAVPFGEFSP